MTALALYKKNVSGITVSAKQKPWYYKQHVSEQNILVNPRMYHARISKADINLASNYINIKYYM